MEHTKASSMSETSEPLVKRAKFSDIETIDCFIDNIVNSKKNLKAVMSDEFFKPIPLISVYVGQIKNVKEISKVIQILNEKIPLKELSHLKRARKKEVILCPINYLNTLTQAIQDYLDENVSEIRDSFEYFKVLDVPVRAPKLKKQQAEYCKSWSLNFHPDNYLEQLFSNEFFSEKGLVLHRQFMGMTFDVARWYLSRSNPNLVLADILLRESNSTIVVDPKTYTVVAVAFDNRDAHPVQHSAMMAIDKVAMTQNGGAWASQDGIVTLRGIDKDLLEYLKMAYPKVSFGARPYFKTSKAADSPYLCTGYYVYMMREPCIMCAMGLVHARAKRVFFCCKNSFQGALCSKTKLQCISSLNHHFEVFTDFL